jgi:hypothetical protein
MNQGCRIFLSAKYQHGGKYTKWPQPLFNGRKIDQMVLKYTKIFHCQTIQNIPKLGFLVRKQTIWQPWYENVDPQNFGNFESFRLSCQQITVI